jgi:hypothetical protein
MRNQDDRLGEDQLFWITVFDQALSPVIRTCLPCLEEGRRRKDLFDKNLNFIRLKLTTQHFTYL